jgi:hypothetical protein
VLIGDIQGCFLEFQARYFGECAGEGLFGFLPQFAWIGKNGGGVSVLRSSESLKTIIQNLNTGS